jgi:hypothetical protein
MIISLKNRLLIICCLFDDFQTNIIAFFYDFLNSVGYKNMRFYYFFTLNFKTEFYIYR